MRENRKYARRQLIWFRKSSVSSMTPPKERETVKTRNPGRGHEIHVMPQTRESEARAAQPNIQDVFLNYARRKNSAVHIRLMDGTDLEGRVKNFDRFAVIVEHSGAGPYDLQACHRRHPFAAPEHYSSHEA